MTREELIEVSNNRAELIAAGFNVAEAEEIVGVKSDIARLLLSVHSDTEFADENTSPVEVAKIRLSDAASVRLRYLRFFRENGCDSRKAMDALFADAYRAAEQKLEN